MHGLLNKKFVQLTAPGAIVDNASLTVAALDTAGWNTIDIVVVLGATDIAMTALKLQECDTSGGTYTDVPNGNFANGTQIDGSAAALPSATDDNKAFVFHIPTKSGRKRFFKLVATGGDGVAGAYINAHAWLSNAEGGPIGLTERGLGGALVCR